MLLNNNQYCSIDGIVKFISDISNNTISLSKGTIYNWNKELNNLSSGIIEDIKMNLKNSYYVNADDSTIKVNGENYFQHCVSNKDYTFLTVHNNKSSEAIEEIGLLSKYTGIIIKDGTNVYDDYGSQKSQCLSHILRYLKGVVDFREGSKAKKLKEFLSSLNDKRNQLISNGITAFTNQELDTIYCEYDKLIDEWETNFKIFKYSEIYVEERRLLNRMKEKDREEILYFLKDFRVPSTNNQAEVDQRGIKIKQKVGKFRSFTGALFHTAIKSLFLTLKKQGKSIYETLIELFSNKKITI